VSNLDVPLPAPSFEKLLRNLNRKIAGIKSNYTRPNELDSAVRETKEVLEKIAELLEKIHERLTKIEPI
jgi:prefoldin subunit 5